MQVECANLQDHLFVPLSRGATLRTKSVPLSVNYSRCDLILKRLPKFDDLQQHISPLPLSGERSKYPHVYHIVRCAICTLITGPIQPNLLPVSDLPMVGARPFHGAPAKEPEHGQKCLSVHLSGMLSPTYVQDIMDQVFGYAEPNLPHHTQESY